MTDQPPQDPQQPGVPPQGVPQGPAAGWYPDPDGQQVLRWWSGMGWTPHTQPLAGPQGGPAPAAQPQPAGRRASRRSGKSHWVRNVFAVIGALVVAGIIITALEGGKSTGSSASPGAASVAASAPASGPASAAAPASPTPPPPTKVEFIVSGSAPDGIDITYGPAGSNLSGPSVLDGTAKMTMTFDASTDYYAMNAQLQGDGSITCKIVATGPGDQPLTVSSGAASGGYNICSAQAAPENGGLNWENEN